MAKVMSRKSAIIQIELGEEEALELVAILGSVSGSKHSYIVLEGLLDALEIAGTEALYEIYAKAEGIVKITQ